MAKLSGEKRKKSLFYEEKSLDSCGPQPGERKCILRGAAILEQWFPTLSS
jgi:hypothetical protein